MGRPEAGNKSRAPFAKSCLAAHATGWFHALGAASKR